VECASALARLEREGRLGVVHVRQCTDRLKRIAEGWHEVQPQGLIRESAKRLLRVHGLRAGDALQLAAATIVAANDPASSPFVCLDDRLVAAAMREGFVVATGAEAPFPEPP
jgi:predicted nucleic acid-binding protein